MRVAPILKLSKLCLCHLVASTILLLGSGSASAISISPPPGSGLGPDDLTEIYCPCDQDPNPHITRNILTAREGFDAVSGAIPHEWGIYFADDPAHLIPLFTAPDAPSPLNAAAAVDFDHGTVTDLDTLVVEFTFDPRLAKFGFYVRIDDRNGPVLTYSQATLNGGTDTFGSFPSLTNPNFRAVAFEVGGRVLSIETVMGACAVPEPSVVWMVGGGLSLLAARRRSA